MGKRARHSSNKWVLISHKKKRVRHLAKKSTLQFTDIITWGLKIILTSLAWIFLIYDMLRNLFLDAATRTSTLGMLIKLFGISLIILFVFALWKKYNFWRYSHLKRRKHYPPTTVLDLAVFYGMDPDEVAHMQQIAVIDIYRNDMEKDEVTNLSVLPGSYGNIEKYRSIFTLSEDEYLERRNDARFGGISAVS